MQVFFFIILILCGVILLYQDYSSRTVSLWVLVLFLVTAVSNYLTLQSWRQLLENAVFTVVYLSLCTVILAIYFKVKGRNLFAKTESYIGSGDLVIISGLGLVMEPVIFLYFNTFVFIISIVIIHVINNKKTVPLAGNLAFSFVLLLLVEKVFDLRLTQLIDA